MGNNRVFVPIAVLLAGVSLLYTFQKIISDLPSQYTPRPGSASNGLDGDGKIQQVLEIERDALKRKVDEVGRSVDTARTRQQGIEDRIRALAVESEQIRSLAETLRVNVGALEREHQAVFTAAEECSTTVAKCVKPSDVENRLSDPRGLREWIEDESGPLRTTIISIMNEAQANDEGCANKQYIDTKWREYVGRQDDVGMRDYASLDLGATVVHHKTSPAYTSKGAIFPTETKRIIGLGHDVGSARDAISKGKNRGDCFPFNGQVQSRCRFY